MKVNSRNFVKLLTLLGAAPLVCLPAPARAANERNAPRLIRLEPYLNEHWAFKARIKGREELFVMDTGGGLTAVPPEAAAEIGCEPFSKMLPKDAAPIAGNVGLDAFAGRVITLDIGNRQLVIETPKSLPARIAAAKEVPVQFIKESEGYSTTIAAALDTAKGRIWMHLDSGDDVPITIGSHVASAVGLDPQKKGAQPLDTSLVGGVVLRGSAHVKDIIFDGNVGAPVISGWVMTMDMVHQRLWIAPAGKN
jgi:hypothetical protein